MKRTAILYGVMLGLAAVCAGIPATARAAAPTKTCETGKPCEVIVTVVVCAPGGVTLDHDVIGLKRGNGNIPITWKISGDSLAQAVFAPRGIEFKTPIGDQFKDVAAGEKQFKWVGVNSAPNKEFRYLVKIQRNGFDCTSLDPSVVNE